MTDALATNQILTPFQLGVHSQIILRILLSFPNLSTYLPSLMTPHSAYALSIRLASLAQTSGPSTGTTAGYTTHLSRLLAQGGGVGADEIRRALDGEGKGAGWFGCGSAGSEGGCRGGEDAWVACSKVRPSVFPLSTLTPRQTLIAVAPGRSAKQSDTALEVRLPPSTSLPARTPFVCLTGSPDPLS